MKKFYQSKFDKILLLFLVFSGLFIYCSQASAFLDVIPSMASMWLDALDFIDNIVTWLFSLLLLALAGAIFITFSAAFLDWASNLPVVLSNDLINAGWGFTSGLVNMIFILVFVFIAFSYILKLETWGMKKALPRLIIVAFLLNFSLLFVKMFVDVGWIFQNSLKVSLFGGDGLATMVAKPIADSAVAVVAQYFASFFLPYILIAAVPFLSAVKLATFATTILIGESLFGAFSETFVLATFSLIGGFIFFVYGILFLVRIVVIWLLAIVAPLAFAAYILPQTQKYFTQWLKTLFQWVFLGIVVFFLMGLGLKLFSAVASTPAEIFKFRGFNFIAEYFKFLFLIIYLAVALSAAKKFTPAGANAIWALGGLAVGGGTALVAAQGRRLAMRGMTWESGLSSKRAEARMKPLQAKETDKTITPQERAQLGKWTARYEKAETRIKMFKGLRVQEEKKKLLEKIKNMDEETAKMRLSEEAEGHKTAKLKGLNYGDKAQAIAELLADKNAFKTEHKALFEEASKNAGPDDIEKNRFRKLVLTTMPQWAKNNDEMTAIIEKMSPADIDKLNRAAKSDEKVIEAIVATNKSNLISKLAGQNAATLKIVQDKIRKTVGKDWREKKDLNLEQLKLLRSLHNSPLFADLGFETYGDLSEIQEKIKSLGAAPKPPEKPKLWTPGKGEPEMPPKPKV